MPTEDKKKPEKEAWHSLDVKEAVKRLESDLSKGLSRDEVKRRLEEHGPNEISGKKTRNTFLRFLDNFKQPLIYIPLIAGTVSLLIGKGLDAVVIYGVAFLNALISFIQESKAERAIAGRAATVAT